MSFLSYFVKSYELKVSLFRNVFLVSSILPKNERKQFDLRYHNSKVEFFRSFFGRIEDTKKTFRNKLTFSNIALQYFDQKFQ